ncbi:MAG: hypothetical protein FJW23_12110 [Acidimicrobiia bacterium]|nr:hypothetical protein [Acidimicrobiia bacterium]
MIDTGIGRLLVVSLHQSIAEVLPTRLEFYEAWLNPVGLRDGRVGMAPMSAALSFLRREGALYAPIVSLAGDHTADWTYDALPGALRRAIHASPRPLRIRLALRVVRRLVRDTYQGSGPLVRWRRDAGAVLIQTSIFCGVRDRVEQPLCTFYAAAIRRLLERFDLRVEVTVSTCRATGAGTCELHVQEDRAGGGLDEGRSLLH